MTTYYVTKIQVPQSTGGWKEQKLKEKIPYVVKQKYDDLYYVPIRNFTIPNQMFFDSVEFCTCGCLQFQTKEEYNDYRKFPPGTCSAYKWRDVFPELQDPNVTNFICPSPQFIYTIEKELIAALEKAAADAGVYLVDNGCTFQTGGDPKPLSLNRPQPIKKPWMKGLIVMAMLFSIKNIFFSSKK